MKNLTRLLCTLALLAASNLVYAQEQTVEFKMRKSGRLMNVSVPLLLVGHEAGMQLEFNLGGEASFAISYIHVGEGEEFSKKRMEEERSSLITSGREFAVQIARFSQGQDMGGFFYTLGAGYRVFDATWRKPYESSLGLSPEAIDEENRAVHKLQARGATARGRLGYRYVGETWPLTAGAFIGARHYENKFEDRKSNSSAPTTDAEKEELSRIFMTKPELGVEVGFTF